VHQALGLKNGAEFAGETTKTRHSQVIKIAKMAKNGQNDAKRNHRAHKWPILRKIVFILGQKMGQ